MNPLYAFRVYLDTNMLRIFLLGFSSGLPFPLVVGTLSFWLREEGVSKTDIGLFALVGTPWVIKFLWAPIVDQLSIPYLTRRLGSRRSWILLSQCGLIASIIALGSSDPTTNLWWMAFFALCVSTCSATQDIGIDAYRIEALQQDQQGAGAAAIVFGWRIGALVSGAAPFFVASQTSWFVAYLCMALLMGLGIITMIFSREPDIHGDYTAKSWEDWIKHAVINPFTEFMTRQRWLLILVFIILYKLGDAIALTMLSPFAVDLY